MNIEYKNYVDMHGQRCGEEEEEALGAFIILFCFSIMKRIGKKKQLQENMYTSSLNYERSTCMRSLAINSQETVQP